MNAHEIIKGIEDEQLKAEPPVFHVGDTVKVYGKIKEGNRERIQVFEGIVLKRQGGSNPNVEKVEVIRFGKVRRAKLNYLRGRTGKSAKVKELVR